MTRNNLYKLVTICIFLVFSFYNKANLAFAQINTEALEEQDNAFMDTAPYDETFTIGAAVATVIKAFLGLLGITFIFLMVLAGYHWMTAAGDEQKITKAKDTIRTAIIGLVIIVAAYSITYFVFKALGSATG